MSRFDRKTVTIAAVVVIAASQAALALVAWLGRVHFERQLDEERAALSLQIAATGLEPPPARPGPESKQPGWQLLDNADVARTLQVLQVLGDAAGVECDGIKAVPATTAGRQSFAITGRGRPEQVCEFLASIEQDERLMVVESGRLQPAGDGRLGFEVGLATFHRGGGK